jgi:uncharacterized protein
VLALALCIVLGFAVESTVGFGATLVSLSLGSMVMPTEAVLARIVPLNLLLSLVLVVRGSRHVDVRRLFLTILPAILLGMPIGVVLLRSLDAKDLRLLLAGLVFFLAALELVATARAKGAASRPLSSRAAFALLFAGGIAHGALATGGPPVVYVAARVMRDKATFRATLSALWLVLNIGLLTVYSASGFVNATTLTDSVPLVGAVVVGLIVGDVVHRKVPERAFKLVVFAMLLGVAVLLVLRR